MIQLTKNIRTVNVGKPKVEYTLFASNDKGYCPVNNREIIGIMNARKLVKRVLNLKNEQVEMVLNKIYEEGKFLVFGKTFDPYFDDKVRKVKNAIFLGGPQCA